MKARLLDATVQSLFDKGYGRTTTLEVQQRAGVSRGALLHHYGSRSELMLAAVNHLTTQRINALVQLAQSEAPPTGRIDWAVRVLWTTFDGPLFTVSLELWLAARTDAELLTALRPQERMVGRSIRGMAAELFGQQARASLAFAPLLELLLDAMRGAAARSVLRSTSDDERLLRSWVELAESRLEPGSSPAADRQFTARP